MLAPTPALSIEVARREKRKQDARNQKKKAAETEKEQQFGKFFQYTVPSPARGSLSADLLLKVRGRVAKPPWSQRTEKGGRESVYSSLCLRTGPQIALQYNAQWGDLVEGFSWDYKKAQNFPALSVCVSKVSCAFVGWKPAVLRSSEASRVVDSSPAEKSSWVCKPIEEPAAFEVVSMEAQLPGPVGYELLRRALPQAVSSRGHHLRAAMDMVERYRSQAQHVPLSCVVNVHGCSPYFLLRWPPAGSRANPEGFAPSAQHVFKVQQHLETLLEQHQGQLPYKTYFKGPYVVGCKLVERSPLKGLRLDEPWKCVEVHFCHKQVVSWALSIFDTKRGERPVWDWDRVWRYEANKTTELDSRHPRPEYGKHRVELLNANVDPEIQFVTDHRTSGRRRTRLPEGKYLLTPCFPEGRWNRRLRTEVFERRFLPAFRIDVHHSYLEPEVEEKPLLPLKVCVFDIEVASRTGRFPSALRGDHIIQVAVETYYDLTEDPVLKAHQERTVFCLGETPSFRTPDGNSVCVVDYSVRQVFLFLVSQALSGGLDKLFDLTQAPLFCALLDSFLAGETKKEDAPKETSSALFPLAEKLGQVLSARYAPCELHVLAPETTEAIRSKKRNSGRAACLRTPVGQWGSWDWVSTNGPSSSNSSSSSSLGSSNYADFLAREHQKPGFPKAQLPDGVSSVQHEAARFLFTVFEELRACGGSATQFRQHSEAYRRAIDLAEAEMLQDCVDWFRRIDASVICGHNTDGYDIPEMLRRAHVLGTPSAWVWSNRALPVSVEDTMFQSAASGTLKITKVEFPGLAVSFDTLKYFKKLDYSTKLSRYNLNTVAAHFLDDQKKADMKYQDLPLYFSQGPRTRLLEAMYCMQDVDLLWMVLRKRKPFHELLALMERSGISLNHMINKGQMYQSNLQLRPICNEAGVGTLWGKKQKEASFQGATVVEPNRGYYDDPVVTLDFASLYPSIMSAFNICFTTVVHKPKQNLSAQTRLLVKKVPREQGESPRAWFLRVFRVACAGETAEGCLEHTLASLDEEGVPRSVRLPPRDSPDVLEFIVRKEHKKGLLPGIVEDLMRLRKITKKEMHKSEGIQKTLLNAKQLAQKLMQNSMYGSASLIWRVVGLLITFYGRQLIEFTRRKAEELGAKWGARVVYGDTDSVFVKLSTALLFPPGSAPSGAEVVARAREAGVRLEELLNELYRSELGVEGIHLECEAVLENLLLTNKKRYTALMNEVTGTGTRAKGVYTRGMANVRGDQPKFIKENFEMVVKTLIYRGLDQAVVAVQCLAARLLHGEIRLEKLIQHKGYKKEFYADPVPGHIQLARRLGLQPGDQIPFVLVRANSKALQAEKMESPRSLDGDCQVSYREYLERFLVQTFSGLLAIPLTQKTNEIGARFGDPKESNKDLKRRKKLTQKAIFEQSSCCVCRTPLALAQGFPLCLKDRKEAAALHSFFASSGAKKKKRKQATLTSLWSSPKAPSGAGKTGLKAPPAEIQTNTHKGVPVLKESLELGTKWFLCKPCVLLVIQEDAPGLPGAQAVLSKTLLQRKLLPQLSLFRPEHAEPAATEAAGPEPPSLQKHSSRQNTLKRSFASAPQPEAGKKKKRRTLKIEYSVEEKETLRALVSDERQKVALFQKTCKECREGTGLHPKDCDADSCEQWFSRDISRRRLRDLEQAHEALC